MNLFDIIRPKAKQQARPAPKSSGKSSRRRRRSYHGDTFTFKLNKRFAAIRLIKMYPNIGQAPTNAQRIMNNYMSGNYDA